jgi:hypothetical protein
MLGVLLVDVLEPATLVAFQVVNPGIAVWVPTTELKEAGEGVTVGRVSKFSESGVPL